ncbi:heme ABC exporter ATP-binding protein CcmA [Pelosinus propionicus]|uniref:Heme exporter protein A n=1 Tax=Pelosinus propionicus DSM 13327 TaxID=1123291 RepID=A0A1I4PCI5_9FIRM|nr:heme ABC exporter ATP-binding protein CcmA [Pelosinus propionicus]SFM25478.1 heme exporter protein A [Pelosinus propionicus DSM 13327]
MYRDISVNLVDVSKKIGTRYLFTGINLVINAGQCLAITGPNGSGKSTLLKIIAGLNQPTTGAIQIISNNKQLDAEERRGSLGLISPEIILYADLTGYENILFFTRLCGIECNQQMIEEYCRRVGLANDKEQLVRTYSTGMRQRLKFALMLAIQPGLWLLDEPSSNLDADGKKLIAQMIGRGLEQNATIIIATNEPWEAEHADYKIELV